jgi:hypothetical protein
VADPHYAMYYIWADQLCRGLVSKGIRAARGLIMTFIYVFFSFNGVYNYKYKRMRKYAGRS